jgi:hypothetical protein
MECSAGHIGQVLLGNMIMPYEHVRVLSLDGGMKVLEVSQ